MLVLGQAICWWLTELVSRGFWRDAVFALLTYLDSNEIMIPLIFQMKFVFIGKGMLFKRQIGMVMCHVWALMITCLYPLYAASLVGRERITGCFRMREEGRSHHCYWTMRWNCLFRVRVSNEGHVINNAAVRASFLYFACWHFTKTHKAEHGIADSLSRISLHFIFFIWSMKNCIGRSEYIWSINHGFALLSPQLFYWHKKNTDEIYCNNTMLGFEYKHSEFIGGSVGLLV